MGWLGSWKIQVHPRSFGWIGRSNNVHNLSRPLLRNWWKEMAICLTKVLRNAMFMMVESWLAIFSSPQCVRGALFSLGYCAEYKSWIMTCEPHPLTQCDWILLWVLCTHCAALTASPMHMNFHYSVDICLSCRANCLFKEYLSGSKPGISFCQERRSVKLRSRCPLKFGSGWVANTLLKFLANEIDLRYMYFYGIDFNLVYIYRVYCTYIVTWGVLKRGG